MAQYKDIVTDIMGNHLGKEITRAWLIAAIEDALLVERGVKKGRDRQRKVITR